MEFIDQINDHLNRLGVSTEQDPNSGLEAKAVEPKEDTFGVVSSETVILYDDYDSGFYKIECLLETLETLNPNQVDLDSESNNNIWQLISDCEV